MYRFGPEWMLTPFRLAVHLPTKTAVIADPHLGYSDARRRAGDAVPIVSLEEQLAPLKQACAVLELESLIVAGDLCEARLVGSLIERFVSCLTEWKLTLCAIVPGNHDRGWADFRDRLPMHPEGFPLGSWTIVHGDRKLPEGPVLMGHVHPAWRMGRSLRPCFLVRPNRIVLPAFSSDAAGGAVNHAPRWTGYQAVSIDGEHLRDRGLIQQEKSPRRGLRRGLRR